MDFLRVIVMIFMIIWLPVSNFFASLGKPAKGTFTDLDVPVKIERAKDEFVMGGNDIILNGDGLEEAVAKIKANSTDENISVWMHGGEYQISDTVDLSGMKNVTFRAFPDEKVSVTSCTPVSGWTEGTANGVKVWVADVSADADFYTLYKGDEKLSVTRYPETGYLFVKEPDTKVQLFNEENSPWLYTRGDMAFYTNGDIELKEFHNLTDVQLKLMHYWYCERTTLTSYENGRIGMKVPCTMIVQKNDRYFLENVFEALDKPGEWYHDKKAGKLYYVPQDGDDINTTSLYAPKLTKLFNISDAENIEFKNITFKNTDWCYPEPDPSIGWLSEYNLIFPQGNLECEGVVDITRSQGINFTDCDFLNIGNTAIRFQKICHDCTVAGCTFKEIGANVVFVNGNNTADVSRQTYNIKVIDNLIEGYGRNFPSGIGILSTHARDCTYSHNEIHDGYYTAISCGWMWGYSYSVSDGNIISENLIYDIGQGWLSDMGGIYTLGMQPHTVLTHNKIYNVAADPNEGGYGGWGIYLDEGSSGITVYQNLVYNCGSDSFHQHYGQDNLIVNNIFALSGEGQIRNTRKEDHNELHLMRNIIVSDNTAIYSQTVQGKFTDSENLYWDYTNGKRVISSTTADLQQKHRIYKVVMDAMGYYCGGVFEDPLFRNAKGFDFTLAEESPAITEIGFEPWNYNTAGTLTNFR